MRKSVIVFSRPENYLSERTKRGIKTGN